MRRALHFVFKIADRKATMDFYRNVLGMKVRVLMFYCLNSYFTKQAKALVCLFFLGGGIQSSFVNILKFVQSLTKRQA